MLVQHTEATLGFRTYPTLANALVFAFAALAGSFFETQGSRLEVAWDKEREETYAVQENWFVYLSRVYENEPVGYRYISRLVTTLYSELAMIYAAPLFALGASILAAIRFQSLSLVIAIFGLALAVASGFYFYRQARCTHDVICQARKEINARGKAS